MASTAPDIILEMSNITKEFSGVKALSNVRLEVRKNEIHAICGENGAGKSTLMNILSGVYPHGEYTGDILYNGHVCTFKSVKDSEAAGIAIIHQELALSPYLSIAENIFIGNEQKAQTPAPKRKTMSAVRCMSDGVNAPCWKSRCERLFDSNIKPAPAGMENAN